jgi:hypothetical protein
MQQPVMLMVLVNDSLTWFSGKTTTVLESPKKKTETTNGISMHYFSILHYNLIQWWNYYMATIILSDTTLHMLLHQIQA